MTQVIGIGGVFIKFKDPSKLREWYSFVLVMATNDYVVMPEFHGNTDQKKRVLTTWYIS